MSGLIYKGQTYLRITLTTGIDLSGATAYIIYEKPSGTVGTWNANIQSPHNEGTIYYDVGTSADINEAGNWTFWASIYSSTGKWAPGEPFTKFIYEPGKPR